MTLKLAVCCWVTWSARIVRTSYSKSLAEEVWRRLSLVYFVRELSLLVDTLVMDPWKLHGAVGYWLLM